MRLASFRAKRAPSRRSAGRAARPVALWLLGLLGASCEELPASPGPPRVLAVDLLDAQDVQGGQPARRRLYDGQLAQAAPESGPDLSLRLYLSAPLSSQSLSDAPGLGVLLRDGEGMPVTLRSVAAAALDLPADGPLALAGVAQALAVLPDLRSGRGYILSLDRGYLLTDDMTRFEVPPPLSFTTARRFVVLRADPVGQREIAQLRLTLSSAVHARPSGLYGVSVVYDGKDREATYQLSGNGRLLTLNLVCPLPKGTTTLTVPTNGLEEDDTLAPLAVEFQQRIVVNRDPEETCTEAADMAADMTADMARDLGDLARSDM